MVIYSHSRLSTFEQCRLKFKFKYIDRLPSDFKETIESFLGKKVHNVLEWIYNHPCKNTLDLDNIIKRYISEWGNDFDDNIKITNGERDVEHYFNKGIKFLIDYFITHTPFKDNTIATEIKIIAPLDSDGKYRIQGYIDRLVHHKETNIFEIHDYKTSSSLKSQEELDSDRQLALYCIGVRDSFKEADDVHLVWHFLDYNKKITSKRTSEQLEQLKQEVIQLIDKIESTKEFPPNQSALCAWCEFQSSCPLYKENKEDSHGKENNNWK